MTPGERAAARALEAVGCRFRPHGRDPAAGFDCVGLVAHAWSVDAGPAGYAMRGATVAMVAGGLRAAGFREAGGAETGDVVVARAGPGAPHLLIVVEGGFVHADAVARRVVERPAAPPWPVEGRWRRG